MTTTSSNRFGCKDGWWVQFSLWKFGFRMDRQMLEPSLSEMQCQVCSCDAGTSAAVLLCDLSHTPTPLIWPRCAKQNALAQDLPRSRGWCCSISRTPSSSLCSAFFVPLGSTCPPSALHKRDVLVSVLQTCDRHDLPILAGSTWAWRRRSPSLLFGVPLCQEFCPAIWCAWSFWGSTCEKNWAVWHVDSTLSRFHRRTVGRVARLGDILWAWFSCWYLFFPILCHKACRKQSLPCISDNWLPHQCWHDGTVYCQGRQICLPH